jgi:wobble nucleotide-excising tRNase
MLRRVIAIKNVGRFRNSAATPNPALAKHTFIFAGNGFGKTTLCTVMRSVQSGDAAPVHGRRTLGATNAPEIDLLFADGNRRLQNGSWSATAPKISIFDGVFVAANVHSGDVVDVAHRRNLYRVIVGAEGVGLAEQEQALAEEARAKQAELTAAERAVQALVPSGIALGNFLDLPADPGIDAKIDAQRQTLNALKQAETIRTCSPGSTCRAGHSYKPPSDTGQVNRRCGRRRRGTDRGPCTAPWDAARWRAMDWRGDGFCYR